MSEEGPAKYALADRIAFQITSRVVDSFQCGDQSPLFDKLPVDQFAEVIADRVADQLVDKVAALIADKLADRISEKVSSMVHYKLDAPQV